MRAVIYLAAHELRARWRGWAVLVVLVAVAGGAVLAAAAGALRTDSAYPRFLTASKASDVVVVPYGSGLGGYFDALARLPGAAAVAAVAALTLETRGQGGLGPRDSTVLAPVDGRFGQLVDVPRVLTGRLPAAGSAGEIAVDQRTAARMGLQAGSVLTMRAVSDRGPVPAWPAPALPVPACCGSGWSASWSPADRSCPLTRSTRPRSSWSARRCSTSSVSGTCSTRGRMSNCGREPPQRRSRSGHSHLRASILPQVACSSPLRARRPRPSSMRSGPRR